MKLKSLKYALLGLVICLTIPEESFSQLFLRHPTNVRYIGGGFNDKRPYFNDLLSTLNDVKPYATSENPYVFWVASDTIQIADWDSVYQTGGLSMKDSIDVHYVATGKIKWAGFGQGGGGSGITSITPPQNLTTYYDLWTWTGQSGLGTWQDRLGENADSIDLKLWELIVYTDSVYLYIENDTLKLRTTSITALVSHDRPDTTLICYNTQNETISGDWTFNGDVAIGTGSLRLPTANNNTGTSRILWSASNIPYWSGSGAVGDSSIIALRDSDTGNLVPDSLVTWDNLQDEVQDSINAWKLVGPPHVFLTDTTGETYTPDVTSGTPVKITPAFINSGNGMTFAGDTLTVNANGGGDWYMSFSYILNVANTDDIQVEFRVNDAVIHVMTASGSGAADYVTVSSFHYEELDAGDDISFYVDNLVDNDDPEMSEINVWMQRIHQ